MPRIIDSNDKNLIGDKVKALRKAKKMSQQTLSDRLETMAIMYAGVLFPELRTRAEPSPILNSMVFPKY